MLNIIVLLTYSNSISFSIRVYPSTISCITCPLVNPGQLNFFRIDTAFRHFYIPCPIWQYYNNPKYFTNWSKSSILLFYFTLPLNFDSSIEYSIHATDISYYCLLASLISTTISLSTFKNALNPLHKFYNFFHYLLQEFFLGKYFFTMVLAGK